MKTISDRQVVDLIADALYAESALELPNVCVRLGIAPGTVDEAFRSKRKYVRARLVDTPLDELRSLGERVLRDHPHFELEEALALLNEKGQPSVSDLTRRNTLEALNGFTLAGKLDPSSFLAEIWPTSTMKSCGHEGWSMQQDIEQHMVRSDDYSPEDILLQLGALECSQARFVRLLEAAAHPKTRGEEEQKRLVGVLNSHLSRDGFELAATQRVSGYPVYTVRRLELAGTASAADSASSELAVLGPYRMERRKDGSLDELGCGAMGVTYRALDLGLRLPVALKVISPKHVQDENSRRRFRREARAAAAVRHANIARALHFGEQGGRFFYAMDLVAGRSLRELLTTSGSLPIPVSLALMAQLAAALSAAHRQGLLHRDLKPANLMLLEGMNVEEEDERTAAAGGRQLKVIDFGLARSFGERLPEESTVTTAGQEGAFLGTPEYASPEQCAGEHAIDGRADLYSLAVILWRCCVGRLPFRGTSFQLQAMHQQKAPPAEELEALPPAVAELLLGLLEKDPAKRRPQSALELARRLDELRRELDGPSASAEKPPPSVKAHEGTAALSSGPVAQPEVAGYSREAVSLAKVFVELSPYGVWADVRLRESELIHRTGLDSDGIADAVHELGAGMVKGRRGEYFTAREILYAIFDGISRPWRPALDALRLATDLTRREDFPQTPAQIAEQYGWPPRRLNPAIAYLEMHDAVHVMHGIGTGTWIAHGIRKTDETRRFAKRGLGSETSKQPQPAPSN